MRVAVWIPLRSATNTDLREKQRGVTTYVAASALAAMQPVATCSRCDTSSWCSGCQLTVYAGPRLDSTRDAILEFGASMGAAAKATSRGAVTASLDTTIQFDQAAPKPDPRSRGARDLNLLRFRRTRGARGAACSLGRIARARGPPLEAIQELLGHSTSLMTMRMRM